MIICMAMGRSTDLLSNVGSVTSAKYCPEYILFRVVARPSQLVRPGLTLSTMYGNKCVGG